MTETYTLNTKTQIPKIGFGTWQITPDDVAEQLVSGVLKLGYRLIDTAMIYKNEKGIGRALQTAGLTREELFITTKVWNDDQGYEQTLQAFDTSLSELGLDYLDLYLIHWPATAARKDSWRALEELYKQGKSKAVGVSNYSIDQLQEIMASSSLLPAVNQIEFHPYIYQQQKSLLEFCKQHKILVEAYSPLSQLSSSGGNKSLQTIAEGHGKSPHQVVLRWCLQHGTLPLPRSKNIDHVEANLAIFDFELSENEIESINQLGAAGN